MSTKREWKPGEVGRIELPETGHVVVAMRDDDGLWYGVDERGHVYTARRWDGKAARPLLVIDPEDREQVERLMKLFWEQMGGGRGHGASVMQTALRSLIAPPKPDEPTGLGAVVEDADGRRWVRHSTTPGTFPWVREGHGVEGWSNIAAVRVLSEGVQWESSDHT